MGQIRQAGWTLLVWVCALAVDLHGQTDSLMRAWEEGRATELFQQASGEEESHWNDWDLNETPVEWPEETQSFQAITQWDPYLANRVAQHFQRNGLPRSPVELQALDYLSSEEQHQLWQQVDALREWRKQKPAKWSKHEPLWGKVWMRYGRRLSGLDRGYFLSPRTHPGSAFLGGPNYWLLRGEVKARNGISLGWCAEKDLGEPWQTNVFDHWSGYWAYQGNGFLERLVVGNFNLQAAQGLTIWSGLRMQLSNELADPMVHARGLTPYAGALENGSMKGLALRLRWKAWRLEPFFSKDKVSGQFRKEGDASIGRDGLHRTPNALQRKDQLNLQNWGFYLRHSATAHRFGLIFHQLWLNDTKDLRNGIARNSLGLEWVYAIHDKRVFTEWTVNNREGWGGVVGAHIPLSSSFKLGSRWMVVHPLLHHPASPLLDAARAAGRKEWSMMAEWRWTSKIMMSWNFQQYQEWQSNLSSSGQMPVAWLQVGLEYRFSPRLQWLLQYRKWEEKAPNAYELLHANRQIHRWRLQLNGRPSDRWYWRFRWENMSSPANRISGFFSFQEVGGKLAESWRWSSRLSVFRIPHYDLRTFGYLPDVSQAMNLPMYTGEGHEWHFLVKKAWRQTQWEMRYTYRGSASNSPPRQDLRVQFIQRF